jgi:hypothetical protein
MSLAKEESIIQEFKSKYNIAEIIQSRYNDTDITNFYHKYFEEIEKIEKIGFKIWKMFGELWNEEKQGLIINILSLLLLIEKQIIYLKKLILQIETKKNKKYLLTFMDDINDINGINGINGINEYYIDINKSYSEIEIIYQEKRNKLKEHIEKIINNTQTEIE